MPSARLAFQTLTTCGTLARMPSCTLQAGMSVFRTDKWATPRSGISTLAQAEL